MACPPCERCTRVVGVVELAGWNCLRQADGHIDARFWSTAHLNFHRIFEVVGAVAERVAVARREANDRVWADILKPTGRPKPGAPRGSSGLS